jgi:PAP2 superfamily protein
MRKRRRLIMAAVGTSLVLTMASPAFGTGAKDVAQTFTTTEVQHRFLDNEVVIAWNQKAYDVAFAEDQFLTFKGARAHAMMHIAMHDALNAIVPVFDQYAYKRLELFAHPIAAVAQAAHDVLVSQYPGELENLDAELAKWLGQVNDGPLKSRGIALGKKTAAAILALREGDGFDFQGTYTFDPAIGAYQTTPPWDGFVFQPGFRFAKPFGLASAHQFRPPPPPSLESEAYSVAFNEVKEQGRIDSQARTPEQTGYAVWWMEFAEGSLNRLTRELVAREDVNLWQTARMFALLNMSLFDGYLANWDSKFFYNHWRPYTAIRAAAEDGNPGTEPDATWEPLRTTPPFPEYASAHSTVCGASFAIMSRTLGNNLEFDMNTTTAPPDMPTRSFSSFSSAADECADSRVQLGWHFRYATDAGLLLGRRVAGYVASHHLEPRF